MSRHNRERKKRFHCPKCGNPFDTKAVLYALEHARKNPHMYPTIGQPPHQCGNCNTISIVQDGVCVELTPSQLFRLNMEEPQVIAACEELRETCGDHSLGISYVPIKPKPQS